ncbi:hypothetical protein BC6307_20295 [Sutcliffiella cohnii]|uniref:FHA domain-containing protein n=1 Tax=Sutcliffiella cohnii TaxID=33932 RepID=A0A223KVS2_9BACI|nr:FHA domain-containing protein [Sutcliffiella cohnii]AST93438.1 hypothetical protein BC6307_20295 [Sutcliffiella cohnii]
MGRITIEQTSNKWAIENRLVHPEVVNERELKAITGGRMDGLIPVSTKSNKKGVVVKTDVTGLIPLRTYFTGVVNKKMFLKVISQLITIVKSCEKNLMNVNNLMLDSDYIFVEPRTKKIACIFWPIVNNQNAQTPSTFFQEIPFSVVFNKHENLDYVSSYLSYFKTQDPFSINSFEKFVLEMLGEVVENKSYIPSGSTGSTKFGEKERSVKQDAEVADDKSKNIAYNPLHTHSGANSAMDRSKICSKCAKINVNSSMYCIDCGSTLPANQIDISGILSEVDEKVYPPLKPSNCPTCKKVNERSAKFCADCGSSLSKTSTASPKNNSMNTLNEQISDDFATVDKENDTTVLGTHDHNYGGTTVLGAEEPTFPHLVREKTEEKISVNKPSFRIGKEKSYCDYFVLDNNAVSRSHADIITKGDRYFIVDNNSTNKTYVDDRPIPVKQEVEIFSGTKLKLGNEKFTFYI